MGCDCARAVLSYENGNAVCKRCGQPHTRSKGIGFTPVRIPPPLDSQGRPMACVNRARPSDAIEAVDEVVARGGSQNDCERELRRVLCGRGTPYGTFQKGMQKGLDHMFKALDRRDLPPGVSVKFRKGKQAGEA